MKRLTILTLFALTIAVAAAQFTNAEVEKFRKDFQASYAAAKNKKMNFSAKIVDLPPQNGQKGIRALELIVPQQGDGLALVVARRAGKEVGYTLVPLAVEEVGKKTHFAVVKVLTQLPVAPTAFDDLEVQYVTAGKRMTLRVKNKTK